MMWRFAYRYVEIQGKRSEDLRDKVVGIQRTQIHMYVFYQNDLINVQMSTLTSRRRRSPDLKYPARCHSSMVWEENGPWMKPLSS